MNEHLMFQGAISVKAALENNARPVYRLYMDKNKKTKDFSYLLRLAEKRGSATVFCTRAELDALTNGQSHGGVAATVGQRTYGSLSDLLQHPCPLILLLEGIEDPFNYGNAIRSAYAAGATGLLVPNRTWTNAEDVVIRSSAGASEKILTVMTGDLEHDLVALRNAGIRLVAADRKDAVSLYEADLTGPLLLAVGGRLRGLSHAVYDNKDQSVYIPYGNDFRNALTAASACSVLFFEAYRQRK